MMPRYFNTLYLEDFGSRKTSVSLSGALDPRVEPNDIIYNQSGTVQKLIVDGVNVVFDVTGNRAVLDMSINGRKPRS